jgi:DNA-binding MarR family transcriptional regulator
VNEFVVGDDGLMRTKGARATGEWYAQVNPRADALSQEAQFLITVVSQRIMDIFRRQGFSWVRYNVLRKLSEAPGKRMLMSEIGGQFVSPTNVTKVVDSLVDLDYLRKVQDLKDRRRIWAELTSEGEAAFDQAIDLVVENTNRMWKSISGREKSLLIHVLSKVGMNMRLVDDGQIDLSDN